MITGNEAYLLGFHLQRELRTRKGHEYRPPKDDKDKANPGYRHIVSGNTTYGLINDEGIELFVRFEEHSMADRTKMIPEVLGKYGQLVEQLLDAGIEFRRDTAFESSVENLMDLL